MRSISSQDKPTTFVAYLKTIRWRWKTHNFSDKDVYVTVIKQIGA